MEVSKGSILSTHAELVNQYKKICICRSIKGGTIMKAIRGGALTFEALRKAISVGTGNCGAKRCRPKIEEQLIKYKAEQALETTPDSGKEK